jgi:hypothetical protein
MSVAADIPVRLLEISKLHELPTIIYQLKEDKNLQQIYQKDHPNASLQKMIDDYLRPEQFGAFSKQLTFESSELFKFITEQINTQTKPESNNPPEANDLVVIEEGLQDIIQGLADNPLFLKIKTLRVRPILQILLFLLPFIEVSVWRTKNSNAPIYHELGRMEPLWQLLVLCWFYENREQLTVPPEKPIAMVDEAIGLPHWAIHCFSIQSKNLHFIGVTPPFFKSGHLHNQYLFYVRQGLCFKYCFLAYLSLFALDSTDRPEAEELVAVLLRRSNIENNHRDRHIKNFQLAWQYLGSITFNEQKDMDDLAHRDISLLGQWVTLLAEMFDYFKKIKAYHFSLIVKTTFTSQSNHTAKGIIADINEQDIQLRLDNDPQLSDFKLLADSRQNDLPDSDEAIWYQGDSDIAKKLQERGLNVKFCVIIQTPRY